MSKDESGKEKKPAPKPPTPNRRLDDRVDKEKE